ncbi:MAG: DUF11 domain-containing protein, partial [Gammaproteobacteria bacterium]|nr:DUF11 domain-containing protein [Gammaproteobacteria bacterium]
PAGTYNLSITGTGENAAATGDLDISDTLTLTGAGAASTIIDGNGIDRVFHVLVGPTVTISDVTIRDGDAAGIDGGGIWNESNVILSNVTMSNNVARDGGAIFSQRNPNSLTLSNVTLNGNSATGQGGAIGMKDDNASLTFTDVTMSGNSAVAEGGAFFGERVSGTMTRVVVTANGSNDGAGLTIFNGASNITLTDVTVSSNNASRRGGGILVDAATTTFSRVTVDANSCTSERGGGLHFRGGGLANLTNVTISGNTCDEGGGINVEGGHIVNLNNVTVNANGAPSGGGGLRRSGGTLTILNTIVANSTSGGNCSGTIVSSGTNLDSADTCLLTSPGDLINSNPDLGPLQDNGGLTLTHALGSVSDAIDTGNNTGCPATDQRGVARPIDGDVDSVAVCDIGAYEAPPAISANLALTKTDSADPVSISSAFEYPLTVTNNGPDDASNVTLIDTLPADVDWQSATPSQGGCVHSGEPLGGTVTCTLGTITNGENATVTIAVVAPNTTGVINNSATVSADEADPDASDNTAAEDTTIFDPSANLRVTQVEDYDPAGVNLPFVYTVTVTNQGPADATLVTLTDTLDAAVTYQSAVPSQGSCSESGGTVSCDLGDLSNGSSATIDITVTAPATPQTVTNTAVVSAAEPDSDSADNTSAEDTDVINPPPADLELTQTDSPDPVVAGNSLTYVLTVSNLGPGPATLVELTDTLPAGVTFQSATPSIGSCSESGGTVTCDLGTIGNGVSENVTIVVTAPALAGVITNSASVTTARVDPNSANNSASADTTVTIPGEADLALTQSDSPDPVLVNQTLSYSLLVNNLGPDDATAVVMVDTLPATAAFQSVVTSQGSCVHSGEPSGGTVTCTLGTIASGQDATIDILVTAPSSAGSITNNASVSASSDDLNAANDTSGENTTVENLHVNQLCYLVADAGGGNGGNDLLTQIDTADFDPVTNETNIGTGTGTNVIEAIAWNSASMTLYAANAGQLGTLSTTTGVFTALPQSFGTGGGTFGSVTFSDVDGLSYDATAGVLYGVQARSGTDVLFQIDMSSGAHVQNAFGAGIDYVPLPPIGGNSITDDIAVDPTTGIMYASVNSGGSSDRLITIDKATGTTTDVALITVPDIEGLGTDPSGQLWGTSGTQNILYEIDKTTGTGSNGRPIDNGSDYESVDCYAFSPTVSADLGVSKTVDDPAPPEGDTVTYTVTVTNAGPSTATVVQLSDVLPAGVTFVSAGPAQGTYDSATGDWFVGTVAVGGNATLTLQASVDAATVGTTITNTASVTYLSQNDPNAGNSSASVDITPVAANLTVIKSVATIRDPLGATTPAALAIPGAVVEYEISISNSGNGAATEVIVTDTLDENLTFLAGEFNGGAADIQITVGAGPPVFCVAETGGDSNADGCSLNATGDFLTVTIPFSASYPTGLTVGTAAPDNVAVVHFRVTVN